MLTIVKVRAKDLWVGDYLHNLDVYVTDVWSDDDGTWLATNDDECGYTNPYGWFTVERYYDE